MKRLFVRKVKEVNRFYAHVKRNVAYYAARNDLSKWWIMNDLSKDIGTKQSKSKFHRILIFLPDNIIRKTFKINCNQLKKFSSIIVRRLRAVTFVPSVSYLKNLRRKQTKNSTVKTVNQWGLVNFFWIKDREQTILLKILEQSVFCIFFVSVYP